MQMFVIGMSSCCLPTHSICVCLWHATHLEFRLFARIYRDNRYTGVLSKKNISLSYDSSNLVDEVWGDAQVC